MGAQDSCSWTKCPPGGAVPMSCSPMKAQTWGSCLCSSFNFGPFFFFEHLSFLCTVNRSRNSAPGHRPSRPPHPPARSGPTVRMTITRQEAAALLVGEAGEVVSIPLVGWCSSRWEETCRSGSTHVMLSSAPLEKACLSLLL